MFLVFVAIRHEIRTENSTVAIKMRLCSNMKVHIDIYIYRQKKARVREITYFFSLFLITFPRNNFIVYAYIYSSILSQDMTNISYL